MSKLRDGPVHDFVETKEHRRFAEFCEACRRDRYIGVCYGAPGVGKTVSANRHTRWNEVMAADRQSMAGAPQPLPPELVGAAAILWTPTLWATPQQVSQEVTSRRYPLQRLAQLHRFAESPPEVDLELYDTAHEARILSSLLSSVKVDDPTDLLVIDEADRLKAQALEQVRDLYDRWDIGVVLIGMPGLEKRLSRYAQLYSRVGFVHAFRALGEAETRQLLQQWWAEDGLMRPSEAEPSDETIAAIVRITGGNFRLLVRLYTQIRRLLQINSLTIITLPVVETAREALLIGEV